MKSLSLRSFAKLNLYLKVNFKRPDGYHDLTTLFERINLFDTVKFVLRPQGKIRIFCEHPHVPKDSRNLIYRVAQTLKEDFSIPSGVDIFLTKRIPVAAGLGGGSSNAAAALVGLNKLWHLKLNRTALVRYAQKIGSDVPFFLYEAPFALGTRRGDKIKPLFFKAKLWQILVVPKLKVYTREVFGAFQGGMKLLTKKNHDVNILHRALRKNDLPSVGRLLLNDLETAIGQSHPNLLKIKEKLRKFKTLGVSFSGSGPSLFCLVSTKKEAFRLKAVLRRQYRRVFAVSTF